MESLLHTWLCPSRSETCLRDFPGSQWSRHHASPAAGTGSIPSWGTKILHAAQGGQKTEEKKKKTWDGSVIQRTFWIPAARFLLQVPQRALPGCLWSAHLPWLLLILSPFLPDSRKHSWAVYNALFSDHCCLVPKPFVGSSAQAPCVILMLLFTRYVRLCDPIGCSPPGSSVHGISQARILGWVVISFSKGSSQPRDGTCVSSVSCIAGRFFTH